MTKTPQQQQLWLLRQKQGKLNLGSIFDKNLWCSLAVLTLAKEVWESFTLEPQAAAHHVKVTGELQAYYETSDLNTLIFWCENETI